MLTLHDYVSGIHRVAFSHENLSEPTLGFAMISILALRSFYFKMLGGFGDRVLLWNF